MWIRDKFGHCWNYKCGKLFERDFSNLQGMQYCQDCRKMKEDLGNSPLNPEIKTKCIDCKIIFKQFRVNKIQYDKCKDCRDAEKFVKAERKKKKKPIKKTSKKLGL